MDKVKVSITKCNIDTYESIGSFPELNLNITFTFYEPRKQLANIDLKTLKEQILQVIALQSVKISEVSLTK